MRSKALVFLSMLVALPACRKSEEVGQVVTKIEDVCTQWHDSFSGRDHMDEHECLAWHWYYRKWKLGRTFLTDTLVLEMPCQHDACVGDVPPEALRHR